MITHSTQILFSKYQTAQRNQVSVESVAVADRIQDKPKILLYQKTSIHIDDREET